jgi:8-amino-7-oxononanoate synthase
LLAAAATAAIGCASEMAPQAEKWRAQSQRFRTELTAQGWETPDGNSPIVPVLIGEDAATVALGRYLAEEGFAVGAIRPPTVPEGTARLRLSLKATITWMELESLIGAMNRWRENFRKKS